MNEATRKTYFRKWTAACSKQGWHKGNEKRREVTAWVMAQVRGPKTGSTTDLKPPAVTALMTYLDLAADPESVELSAAWIDCCRDYVSFNRLRQAKFWEKTAGFKGRIRKQRFGGRIADGPLDAPTSEKDVNAYLLTARAAARAKTEGKPRKQFHKKPVEDATGLKPRTEPEVPIINGILTPF